MSNYYTTAEQRRNQNKWRSNSYGASAKEKEDIVARKNAEKEEERRRREAEREEERRRKEAEREAERRRKEAERQAQREAERQRREAEKEAQRQQREAEKAVRQAEERQAKYERELLVAQKRQAQKDAQNTGASLPYSGTAVKTEYSTADNNWGNGKAVPTSSLDGRQWNTGENKAKKENSSVTTEKAVDSTADTAIRWKFLNSSNISKQNSDDNKADLYGDNDSFTPFTGKLKEIQDKYDNDFEFLWAKYGRRLMGVDDEPAQQTAKTKAVSKGPNREMVETRLEGNPQSFYDAVKVLQNTQGVNKEIAQTRLEGNPQNMWSELKKMGENEGVNVETSRTNFLDHRGKSVVDKIVEDIRNEFDIVRYGDESLKKSNHTNTVVTKDNVYSLSTKTVGIELQKVQAKVTALKDEKKQLREQLLFDKYMKYAQGYDSNDTVEIDRQINQLDAEIAKLNIKEMKSNIGYEFCQQYIKQLSEADKGDILNILNEYNNLTYFGNVANTARSAKSGVDKVGDVVSVLDGTKINFFEKSKGFRVFNKSEPENGFDVIPDYTVNNYGFRDYKLSVKADNIEALTPDQKNLYEVLDNMPISEKVYKTLDELPKILNNFDAEKAGTGLTAIGYGLDVVDFLCLVATDYDSSTGTVSKDTTKKVTSMITSWLGGIAGAGLGAAGGAAIGTAILPGVGTVVGGAIGAIVGAYILSNVGEDIGMFIGGLDYDTGTTIEQHLERGR